MLIEDSLVELRVADDTSNVSIVIIEAPMLCNLCRRCRINYTKINLHNNIRDGGVGQRVAETHRLLTGAVNDVLDLKLGGGFF